MKICVDAGHGGTDPGAVGSDPFVVAEKEITLAVSLAAAAALEELGHHVIMPRRRDRTFGLGSRARFANRYGADAYVSVHANAAPSAGAEGMEVYCHPDSGPGHELADEILAAMIAGFPGHRDRGVKQESFVVLRMTRMPAALVECEFLTTPEQLAFLVDAGDQRALGAAVARGVHRWAAMRS
jgi:N-acetylmuramoyl-L-alanine amidase